MKFILKSYLFFAIVVWTTTVYACQCPVTQLNETELSKYDIVFKGVVKQINLQKEKGEIQFTINELYKGVITEQFKVIYNALDECKLDLREGDEWIIYTNFNQINSGQLNFCSRSRKHFKNDKEDFFLVTSGITFDEEMRYLQTHLGLHKCLKNNLNQEDIEHRNIIPNSNQFIIILLVSLVAIIVFYWLLKRFLK